MAMVVEEEEEEMRAMFSNHMEEPPNVCFDFSAGFNKQGPPPPQDAHYQFNPQSSGGFMDFSANVTQGFGGEFGRGIQGGGAWHPDCLDALPRPVGGGGGLMRYNSAPSAVLANYQSYNNESIIATAPMDFPPLVSRAPLSAIMEHLPSLPGGNGYSGISEASQLDIPEQKKNKLIRHSSSPAGLLARLSEPETDSPSDMTLCRARAKRGCATHPRSIAERVRRTKISERMKKLQELVPNMDKQANIVDMLDEAAEYIKTLKRQVEELMSNESKCDGSCSERKSL